jgi:hypothetical protein
MAKSLSGDSVRSVDPHTSRSEEGIYSLRTSFSPVPRRNFSPASKPEETDLLLTNALNRGDV